MQLRNNQAFLNKKKMRDRIHELPGPPPPPPALPWTHRGLMAAPTPPAI